MAATVCDNDPRSAGVWRAVLSGTEVMPTPLPAELLRNGAKLRPSRPPSEKLEQRYRPSVGAMSGPGCSMPANFCDIDHVIPYPLGATHPSNAT
jgi:hypothetical protein